MDVFVRKTPSDRLYSTLFVVLFWAIWLGWPLLTFSGSDDGPKEFYFKMLPVSMTSMVMFFFNTEFLIPRVLNRRGLALYLVCLIALVSLFIVIHAWLFNTFVKPGPLHFSFRGVLPVLFVAAVSTGYGVVTYLIQSERMRQQQQQERLRSELSFLRSQISPHFIFNLLNSIVYLIRSKSDQAEAVTIRLSELMRYMLYDASVDQIPLEKELDYLRNYVGLQKVRFEEDVAISLSVEGEPAGHLIEPMLLIPFVENAFKHGVGMILDPAIDVRIAIEGNKLQFSVRNKFADTHAEVKDGSSGIGLKNVQRRLELLYPEQHHLVAGPVGDWFEVKLDLTLSKTIQSPRV